MRIMGLEAIYPKPRLSLPNKANPTYPYLLRDLTIDKADQLYVRVCCQAQKVALFCRRPVICVKDFPCLFVAQRRSEKYYWLLHCPKHALARMPIIDFVISKVSSPGTIALTTGIPMFGFVRSTIIT